MMTIAGLPPYPSTQVRRQIPASQLASLNAVVASTLAQTIALPSTKRDAESSRIYVRSYARDASVQVLHALIWDSQDGSSTRISKNEELIRRYTLKLAENISPSLDLQTLLDLAIGYSTTKGYKSRLKAVLVAASEAGTSIHDTIAKDLVPAFTALLSPQSSSQTQGLYAVRKTAHCILSFLRVSPPSFVRHFAHSKEFVLSLAYTYDTSLNSIATSYGGINVLQNAINRPPDVEIDDWERIWVETKVALIDTFHIVLRQILEDMSSAKGRSLGIEAERTFDIVFALLEQSSSSSSSSTANTVPLTPFLNRPLLVDYQQSYSLSRTLVSAMRNAEEKDARLDIIESALAAFDSESIGDKEPGALKIVLRSYGIQQGIDNLGTRSKQGQSLPGATITIHSSSDALSPVAEPTPSSYKGKGKAKVAPTPADDPELDIKATQILDVLPDLSPDYVKLLLGSERYKGDLEQVLSSLLEGNAPTEEELNEEFQQQEYHEQNLSISRDYDLSQRQNVFDDQEMNLTQLTTGKKNVGSNFLQDRSFVDHMKADILRRAEAIMEEDEEDEEDVRAIPGATDAPGQASSERVVFSPEDELEEVEAPKIKVMGDGEETSESDTEAEDGAEEKVTPETLLELAWIRDPKLFDRNAATRRSKGREQLRKDTGWADEQIEGWKVMLDRNPKDQEKIKQKHEFRGNQRPISQGVGPSHAGQGRGRGRGRDGRGGRGGGRGGRGGSAQGSGGNPDTVRERSFKDKHKASRGNHSRKREHDKKMARAGAGVLPSS